MTTQHKISLSVNGVRYEREVEPRLTLADFLRHELNLGGTHVGCEHGICGVCTILINGASARACLTFAVQADGTEITTVEGLRNARTGELHPIQNAFIEAHGLQCGFCTPGFMMTTLELLRENPNPSEEEIKDALGGNLCRCTGYQQIVESVKLAASKLREAGNAAQSA
ncbi:Carbon monoxide dehydrogenase small chain [Sterolibacterium denitrificans]|uniref:Carbon monoxide dehydrogenase small chain n=2 Tax=Sterolibacterium denitrificans TaxID=157592 RepID=A0A7Z7MTX7_9PROT|nr:(2Fe-2S)-binding protein [Sterolibacterium denitrificans]KYC28849.1 (2Fe-2S)-binding protein [Sterolibacterium denitrificans]SMB21167.1 Carbon monoxide dehydrogenase small chain [Sterolibacterium denitrificans]